MTPTVRPSLAEIRAMGRTSGQVPLTHRLIADTETPVSAYLKLVTAGQPAFLLESTEAADKVGRYSMIGLEPQAVIEARGDRLTLTRPDGTTEELDAADPFGAVEDVVAAIGMGDPLDALPFWGGAVGFFGYDLVRRVERLPNEPPDDRGLPDMWLMITGPVLVFDNVARTLTIVVPCTLGDYVDARYAAATATIAELLERLKAPIPRRPRGSGPALGPVTSNFTREGFEAAVERVREYIYAGDAFQALPSQRFSATLGIDPFSVYRGLRAVNPSPYMFFVDTGTMQLAGSSPEMHVKVTGRDVELHPIAGTIRRGEDEAADLRLEAELLADPKERAEHVMLVDLGRNDVGRVAEPGTVAVKDVMAVRRYSHVMHIESSVVGRLRDGLRASDALRATFPAGTLSGAPKVRAMEIIDELEPTKRGPYGGAVGYLGWNGDLDTGITIRTIVCADGMAHVQAGAGVVADSVPSREHVESENKAAAVFRAIEVAAEQADW